MPKKITYFLGAGASANALPTIKNFGDKPGLSDSMRNLSNSLKSDTEIDAMYIYKDEISNDLIWLADKSDEFETVDTYAKYLYITADNETLNKLKKTLSIYFTIEQIDKLDKRYIIFLTSIINKDQKFPENIKLVTWNYDYQMQKAMRKINSNIITKSLFHYYPEEKAFIPNRKKEYDLIHLNGIAGFGINESGEVSNFLRNKKNSVFEIITKYIEDKHLLTFAWEKENDTESILVLNERVEKAKYIIQETDVLVIIGYSFPFFNREIDNELFKTLKVGGLKKIYYQDPFNNGKFLKNQFDLSSDIEIEHFEKVDNFLLPLEL